MRGGDGMIVLFERDPFGDPPKARFEFTPRVGLQEMPIVGADERVPVIRVDDTS